MTEAKPKKPRKQQVSVRAILRRLTHTMEMQVDLSRDVDSMRQYDVPQIRADISRLGEEIVAYRKMVTKTLSALQGAEIMTALGTSLTHLKEIAAGVVDPRAHAARGHYLAFRCLGGFSAVDDQQINPQGGNG